MARAVLALAFVVAGFGFLQVKIWEAIGWSPFQFFELVLMLPAVLLGSVFWFRGRSYATSWPVVLCIALVWLSLFYPGNSERMRGLYIGALLTIPLPLAALIVEKRAWAFCAKIYVWCNASAFLLAIWFEMRVATSLSRAIGRFGFLLSENGSERTGNPNQVGGQLAFAAVVAFVLYLKNAEDSATRERTSKFPDVYLILMVLLSVGCMLTASRGAFAAWFPAVMLLFVLGTGRLSMSRMKDLVALSTAGILLAVALLVAGQTTPWDLLNKRFQNEKSRTTMAGRTDIWAGAAEAWLSNPDFIWRGTGIGMADNVAGQFTPFAQADEQGVLRKNCHNAVVEWVLSFGVVGIVAGACLAGSMAYQALRLDSQEQNVGRTALLMCIATFAMTAVSYRHGCWPATSALALAMLTEPAYRRREKCAKQDSDTDSVPVMVGCHFVAPGNARTIESGRMQVASEKRPQATVVLEDGMREGRT